MSRSSQRVERQPQHKPCLHRHQQGAPILPFPTCCPHAPSTARHGRAPSQQCEPSGVHSGSSQFFYAINVGCPLFTQLQGGADVGAAMAADSRLPLISFTGSTAVGRFEPVPPPSSRPRARAVTRTRCRSVGATVGKRLGKTILELGMPLRFASDTGRAFIAACVL